MDDWVEVGLTGGLTGTITGSGNPYCFFGCTPESPVGGAIVQVNISVSGPLYTAPPDEGGVPRGNVNASRVVSTVVTKGESVSFNESVSTGYFWVPRARVSFSAGIFVEAY